MEATKVLNKKNQIIPKLRFKEFHGEWKKKELKDFTKINQGLQIAISERFTEQVDNSFFYITNEFLRKGSKKSFFIKNPPQSVICNENDLLMTRTGNTGQVVTGVSGAFHNNFFKIKFDSTCEKWFLYYFLTSYRTQNTILKLAGTSTIPDLNHGDFYKIKINIPNYSEQQKIATFLSAVDEKIQQLTRKKELLEQYKKGVMQQLFSGKLRFKDENGKAFPMWEEKRLGDLAVIKMGQSPDSKSYNTDSIGMLLIQGNADINGRVTNPRQWTSEPTKICEIGDLILTVRAPVGSISKSLHHACLGRGVCSIKNTKNSNIEFLYQFFLGYEDKWKKIEQGSTFTAVNGNEINSIKLNVPTIFEQKKIANYLSSIDTKIESVATQISQTQTFKKGLLQQMFV